MCSLKEDKTFTNIMMFSGDVGLMLDVVGSKVSDNSMGGLLSLSPHFMLNLFSIHHFKKIKGPLNLGSAY